MRIRHGFFRRQSARKASRRTVNFVRNRSERGIALITSLLLLIIASILGIGMVLSVSSDMLINGYYGNYRSAYYAADTGLNVGRQALMTQILAQVNTTACASWGAGAGTGCTSLPVSCASLASCASSTTALNNVLASWGGSFHSWAGNNSTVANSGKAYNSWPGAFEISSSSTFVPTTIPASCGTGGCQYIFQYNLISLGQGASAQQVKTSEMGYLTITVTPGTTSGGSATTTTSFASFGAFISNFSANSLPLVYGTITGPQFTNGSWNFGSGGTYTFTDPVAQAGAQVSYDFLSGSGYHYVDTANTSASYSGTTIAPNFQQGLIVGAATAPLPADDFSQKWAVLDGMGCGEGSNVCGNSSSPDPPSVTNANLHQYLQDINGNAYSSSGASSGVYLPYTGTSTAGTMKGGGFYVEGNVTSVTLSPGTDSSNNLTQIYSIVQGSTTTTITTNVAANTTKVSNGSKTITLSGVPTGKVTGTATPQTLLYVDGTIGGSSGGGSYTGLSGPGQGQAAIQNGVQLTVVANGDINIVGDLKYVQEPVTLTAADTLIPANNYNQVLGLYTQSGNFVLTSPYSNNNLEIDAALAAIGDSCASTSCGLSTPSSDGINTLTIVGGRMEAYAHSVNMNTSNTYYDRRFLTPGFAPPWFPSTTVSTNVIPAIPTAPSITLAYSRLNWYTSPQN